MKLYVIIVAGGSGSRMNSSIPKQFMLLNKLPVLMHTFMRFVDFDASMKVILVLPENQFDEWGRLCLKFNFKHNYKLVAGGKNRFESVRNGLDSIKNDDGIVLIHDGVRPLVSNATIKRCLETTIEKGNAVPVLPVVESLRKVDTNFNQAVDRSRFVNIQTPQVFRLNEIKKAYQLGYDSSFTDDTTVLERLGIKINLVEGNRENIKITHQLDLDIAHLIMSNN